MMRQLFIMVKEPHPGRVKTRLGRDLGLTASAWWFRHQSAGLIRRLSRDPRYQTILAVSPDIEGMTSRIWPRHLPRWPQGRGNLGARMGAIFRDAPTGPVLIIGADIPDITPALINKAFAALGQNDAVFGPAPDGGYWLIGLKRGGTRIPRDFLQNIRWSSEYALEDTIASLGPQARVALIDTLQDIDTLDDLKAHRAAQQNR